MTNPRQRRKNKRSNEKVSQKSKPIKRECLVLDKTLLPFWDPKKTLQQNFDAAGLANHLNGDIQKRSTQRRLEAWHEKRAAAAVANPTAAFDSEDEIFGELESIFGRSSAGAAVPDAAARANNGAVAALDEAAREQTEKALARPPRSLSPEDAAYIRALIDRHGEGAYRKMLMDVRLNYNQLSEGQLERLAKRL